MLSQAIGGLLPFAAAVALSPIPIVAIVLVLDSARARVNGPAFALGWVLGLAVVSTLVVVVAGDASDPDSTSATGVNWVLLAIGLLFIWLAAKQWRKRPEHGETPEMPAWMATIDTIAPVRAAALGVALSALNPKNLALTVAAAASIAEAGLDDTDTVIAVAVFVVLGSVTVAGAVVAYLVAPRQVAGPLARVRQFMTDNNATIMMVILLLLGLKVLGDALAGLGS
jgi:threonine/homoserine/homoserine lactone efflux protein